MIMAISELVHDLIWDRSMRGCNCFVLVTEGYISSGRLCFRLHCAVMVEEFRPPHVNRTDHLFPVFLYIVTASMCLPASTLTVKQTPEEVV